MRHSIPSDVITLRPHGSQDVKDEPARLSRKSRCKVAAGQIWRKIDGLPSFWEVDGLMQDSFGVTHARLRRVNDPTTMKLVAARSLEKGRLYRLERERER